MSIFPLQEYSCSFFGGTGFDSFDVQDEFSKIHSVVSRIGKFAPMDLHFLLSFWLYALSFWLILGDV